MSKTRGYVGVPQNDMGSLQMTIGRRDLQKIPNNDKLINCLYISLGDLAPENERFQDYSPFENPKFQGAILVLGRVSNLMVLWGTNDFLGGGFKYVFIFTPI